MNCQHTIPLGQEAQAQRLNQTDPQIPSLQLSLLRILSGWDRESVKRIINYNLSLE